MGEKCYFCESTETNYCNQCDHWFCNKCRSRYDKRIIAMVKERFKKMGLEWLTKEEYEEREKKKNG